MIPVGCREVSQFSEASRLRGFFMVVSSASSEALNARLSLTVRRALLFMATNQITLSIKLAWWLKWYLRGVVFAASVTGLRPDPKRVGYWVGRAAKIEVERSR